ncbi:MAG: uroporphyrinogen-III synthase [Trueperaceae bacterium]|nr:uroporphyrinogen-III synthase [Trueperaceae bacterium]
MGTRIALTHSSGRLRGLEPALVARGYDVVRNPLIETVPLLDGETRDRARGLLSCPWLLFTSPAAVAAWRKLNLPFRGISSKIGVVGDKTAATVQRYGGRVALVADPPTAVGLADTFLTTYPGVHHVGLPQGNRAKPTLQQHLEASGVQTRSVVVYKTETLPWRAGDAEVVVLASPSAFKALPDDVAKRATLVAIGPTTAAAIRQQGLTPVVAARPSVAALLDTIDDLFVSEGE